MSDFIKHSNHKPKWSLLPTSELEDIVKVMMSGMDKYGKDNWKKCRDLDQYFDALMRHVIAWRDEKVDPESKLSHMAHAACNALFIMYLEKSDAPV